MAGQVGAFAFQKDNGIQFRMYTGPPKRRPRPREASPAEQPAQRVVDSGTAPDSGSEADHESGFSLDEIGADSYLSGPKESIKSEQDNIQEVAPFINDSQVYPPAHSYDEGEFRRQNWNTSPHNTIRDFPSILNSKGLTDLTEARVGERGNDEDQLSGNLTGQSNSEIDDLTYEGDDRSDEIEGDRIDNGCGNFPTHIQDESPKIQLGNQNVTTKASQRLASQTIIFEEVPFDIQTDKPSGNPSDNVLGISDETSPPSECGAFDGNLIVISGNGYHEGSGAFSPTISLKQAMRESDENVHHVAAADDQGELEKGGRKSQRTSLTGEVVPMRQSRGRPLTRAKRSDRESFKKLRPSKPLSKQRRCVDENAASSPHGKTSRKRAPSTLQATRSCQPKRKRHCKKQSQEEEYEVESILDCRKSDGMIEYRVKWCDYDEDPQYYPEANFVNCRELISEYHQAHTSLQ